MDAPRWWTGVARSAIVAGFGLGAGLAAGPAWAQYDMQPWRPFTGQYRTSSFPAELSNTGDAAFRPGPPAPPPTAYLSRPFAERVAEELGIDEGAARPGVPGRYRNPVDSQVAKDLSQRDRDYLNALKETDPRKRAELMEASRRESRRLARELAIRRQAPPASEARPAAAGPARPSVTTPPATARPRDASRAAPRREPAAAPADRPRRDNRPSETESPATPAAVPAPR